MVQDICPGLDQYGRICSGLKEVRVTPTQVFGHLDSSQGFYTEFNDKLYLNAFDGVHGFELWSFDGTTLSMVQDINNGTTSNSDSNPVRAALCTPHARAVERRRSAMAAAAVTAILCASSPLASPRSARMRSRALPLLLPPMCPVECSARAAQPNQTRDRCSA